MIFLKKLSLHFIPFVLAVIFFSLSFGQNNTIKFTNLSLKEGLTQSSVNCILQDKKGFMWFGTQDGLNRYDGYHFTVFKHDPADSTSLSDNFIQSMFEDKQGVLWIGTEGGLNKFDREKEQFIRYRQTANSIGLSNNIVWAICEDNQANLWIGTADGLNKFDREKETFRHFKHDHKNPQSISSNEIQSLYADKSGALWIGTIGGGLNKFDQAKEKFTVYRHKSADPNTISNNWVWSIFEDASADLWIGTNDGLNKLNRKNGKFERFKSQENEPGTISHNVIRSIFQDDSGILWIGTGGGGLNRFEKEKKQFSYFQYHDNLSSSLANNNVFDIYEDRTGTLWIGTNGGISKFDRAKQNFNHFRNIPNTLNTINSNVVWSILEDKKGILWVGTEEGLNRMDREKQTVKQYKNIVGSRNSQIKGSIYSLFEDHTNRLWVGTDAGIYYFDRDKEKFTLFRSGRKNENGLFNKRIYDIFEDAAHNLWIGTKEGLYRLDEKRKKLVFFQNDPNETGSISNNIIRCIYQDKTGTIWIGTNGGGLNKMINYPEKDSVSFISYKSKDNSVNTLNNNIILSIYEDDRGILWLGTYGGGLNKFNPENNSFSHYTEKDGLSNNVIYSILSDKKGNLWMSTNKGISKFDPTTEKFQNYYENDGLQSNEFNIGAYCKSRKEELFFGGINGFNAFSPGLIQINQVPPQIVLTDFQVFNKKAIIGGKRSPLKKTITETDELTLSYKDAVITFEFAALHYSFPEKNKFAYIMEGFEEDWNYIDQRRQASYTNLDPGNYIFKVKGANSDGIWSEKGITLNITITPPWWKSWWFRTFGIAFILGGFVTVYKSRIKIIESQKYYLETQVKERTGEILNQKQKIEAQKELLEKEKDKVEKLLLNILPQEMVEELKNKGKASARHYRMASVMFTDFKGFTQIAESIRPKDLVQELDRCFIKFDGIIEKYGLEKIKTIGDSYMCAGGLPIRNKSNPIDIVLAGLEIQRYMEELKKEKASQGLQHWELRIGVNTGELIAGVVGSKRFAYDIWGDSVNIANRMEMHGEVGKVNVSGKTYALIKDYFECTYRGKVLAKNKGEVDMYFVDGIKAELSVNKEGIIPNELFRSTLATSLFYKINFKKAEQFILKKLGEELPEDLYYHGVHHTIDVRDAAERIGKAEGAVPEDIMLLKTAAMYHDAGFIKEYFKNEPIGVEMANEFLPNFGYSSDQIRTIEKMIMATQTPQTAKTPLEKILCDADLDYLGRDDFHLIAERLKKELMTRGKIKNDKHWDEVQVSFLEQHAYFTETSKKLRQPEKQKHIEEIKKRYATNQYS